jgi:hypothetical protein
MRRATRRSSQRLVWSIVMLMAVFASMPARAYAQAPQPSNWNQSYDPYVGAIGLALGYSGGSGLSLRWPALPQTMMSISGAVWGSSDDLTWNVGTELHYVLRQAGRTRFFFGPSVAAYSNDGDQSPDVNAALGVGLELLISSRWAWKVDIGFTYLGGEDKIYPLPQTGLYFYF